MTKPARIQHTPRSPDQVSAPVTSEDWAALLLAVKAWLKAGERRATARTQDLPDVSTHHCLAGLDRLYETLEWECNRRRQLEREVSNTQAALAQAHAAIEGTQAEERRARHLALHDCLTMLPNRGHFFARLEQVLSGALPQRRALAVLYIDLDGFKPVNDEHGHDVGDQLLRIVAARLTRAVRGGDMVGRLGGDEFACLLTDLPQRKAQLSRMAHKVYQAIAARCTIGRLTLTVRPSIGIALCPTDGMTARTLLRHADAAMYFAKRQQLEFAYCDQCPGQRPGS